jgi:hypothetical protein
MQATVYSLRIPILGEKGKSVIVQILLGDVDIYVTWAHVSAQQRQHISV